jgi:hypothetical protein
MGGISLSHVLHGGAATDVRRHSVACRRPAGTTCAGMTGVEVRYYGDGTMGEVRLVVSKAVCFGAAARPRGGHDALPNTQPAICAVAQTPEGAILASNEPESRECLLIWLSVRRQRNKCVFRFSDSLFVAHRRGSTSTLDELR